MGRRVKATFLSAEVILSIECVTGSEAGTEQPLSMAARQSVLMSVGRARAPVLLREHPVKPSCWLFSPECLDISSWIRIPNCFADFPRRGRYQDSGYKLLNLETVTGSHTLNLSQQTQANKLIKEMDRKSFQHISIINLHHCKVWSVSLVFWRFLSIAPIRWSLINIKICLQLINL